MTYHDLAQAEISLPKYVGNNRIRVSVRVSDCNPYPYCMMPPAARICLSIEINISKHICHLCHIFLRYPRCACTLQRQCFQSAHALLGYRVKLCDMSSSKAFTQVFSFRYVMPWNMRAAHTCIPVASGSGNIYKSISARVGLTIPAIIVSSPRHLSKDGDRYITVFVLNDSAWNTRPRAFCEIRNCNF